MCRGSAARQAWQPERAKNLAGNHMSTAIAPAVTLCKRRDQLVMLMLLLGAVLVGCGASTHANSTATGGSGGLARFYTQTLAWSACAVIFQCATLTVPLDYANPGGRTIQLAVIRVRATDPAHRIGSLITNPGGPGGSGVQFVEQSYPTQPGQPSHFGAPLRADFDIVGFDPRGVGHSAPITCLSDAQLDHYFALDPTPRTPAQVNSVVAGNEGFAAGCQAHSAMLLPYVGTPSAARDMAILRASAAPRRVAYHLRVAAVATMVLLLPLSACGTGSTKTSPVTISTSVTPVSAITVTIQNFAFRPSNFTVSPGATITVINEDQVIHTLTADNVAFNSGDVANGVPIIFQAPTQPGTYPFHDHLRSYMTGVLTVS